MWEGYWILGNKRALSRLPKDLLTILNDTMNETAINQLADIAPGVPHTWTACGCRTAAPPTGIS